MNTTVKITISNGYFVGITEEFYCIGLDIFDWDEVNNCVDECCGKYLDMHHDAIPQDVDIETIGEAFSFVVEEGTMYEF